MNAKWMGVMLAAAAAVPALARADEHVVRILDDHDSYRIARAADWNPGAVEGHCRLRVWVDDRARVMLRGDHIIVDTRSGRRSFDRGSVCNQPLPLHPVDDFRVSAERARGSVFEVRAPAPHNNYTGSLAIDDPQHGGDLYELVVAWRNPDLVPPAPVVSSAPYPYFDDTRACQERVRADFLLRNSEEDAYLDFPAAPRREDIGTDRDRIIGEAWAHNRLESRPASYECVVNIRANRVVTSSYEVNAGRFASLR